MYIAMKKQILAGAFAIMLTAAGSPAAAGLRVQEGEPPVEIVNENITVDETVVVDSPSSVLPESKIARRMTQAEKSHNAAVNDSWGGAITIIAMCIVVGALIVLSVLFLIFGKVSEAIITSKKKKAKEAADHVHHEESESLAPGEVIAAISLALAEHFGEGHDVEDTILTIRRLQKAYSPWNSKIYNLRHIEDHRRNPSSEIKFNESKRIQI